MGEDAPPPMIKAARELQVGDFFHPTEMKDQGFAQVKEISHFADVDFCYMIVQERANGWLGETFPFDIPGATTVEVEAAVQPPKPTYEERLARIRHKLKDVDVDELDEVLRRMRGE